jgi:hypothetical protein
MAQVGLRQQQAVVRRHKVQSLISNSDSDVMAGSTKREIQSVVYLLLWAKCNLRFKIRMKNATLGCLGFRQEAV